MGAKWFRAQCTAEIYWSGKTYRRGDSITIVEDHVEELRAAGVIGDIKRVEIPADRKPDVETATAARAPEDASRNYQKGRR